MTVINLRDDPAVPAGDTDAAIDFLSRWCGEKDRVVITIDPMTKATVRKDFQPGDDERVRAFIDAAQGALNVYYVANACTFGVTSPSKAHMAAGRALYVDVDAKGDLSIEEAETRCRAFRPAPTHLIFSGGGYQALWRMAPCTAAGWDDRIEAANIKIERAVGGDNCHNVNRLLRLPGTVNVPDASKRARGRVPTLAYLVEADWDRLWSFERDPVPAPDRLGTLPERWREIIRTGDASGYGEDRNRVFAAAAKAMVNAGFTDDETKAVLLDRANGISAHAYSQSDPVRAALRAIQLVRASVAEAGPRFSDDALAMLFAGSHGENLRHVAAWGRWMLWEGGGIWRSDDTLRVFDLSRAVCRVEAMKEGAGRPIASAKTVVAVVSLSRADRRVAATIDQWDPDPMSFITREN